MLVYVLAIFVINGGVVQGFAFMASAIAIFSGVQLFALGILGEYLGRIHERTMGRPPYQVSEQASGSSRPRPACPPNPSSPSAEPADTRAIQH